MPRCRRPRLQQTVTVLVLAQFASIALAQQSPARPAPQQRASITADLANGASFTFNIAPDLPPFTFKLIPDPRKSDQYGNFQSTVDDIAVFRGDSDQPFQHLTGCGFTDMEPPPRLDTDSPWFRTEDINFDGYKDIFLLTKWGATGNQYGCEWLYNPGDGRFDYSKEFSALSRHWLDRSTKTIVTFGTGGMAGAVHIGERCQVDDNLPVLIYSEHQDWDADTKQFHCVVQERRGNDLVTVVDNRDDQQIAACNGSKVSIPPATRLKIDPDVQAQKLISQVLPVYPAIARQVGRLGPVVLPVIIRKDGTVEPAPLKASDVRNIFIPLLGPAMDAVRQWRYQPTLVDGEPVEVETTITVTFSPGG